MSCGRRVIKMRNIFQIQISVLAGRNAPTTIYFNWAQVFYLKAQPSLNRPGLACTKEAITEPQGVSIHLTAHISLWSDNTSVCHAGSLCAAWKGDIILLYRPTGGPITFSGSQRSPFAQLIVAGISEDESSPVSTPVSQICVCACARMHARMHVHTLVCMHDWFKNCPFSPLKLIHESTTSIFLLNPIQSLSGAVTSEHFKLSPLKCKLLC